jgi:hypothetical protein
MLADARASAHSYWDAGIVLLDVSDSDEGTLHAFNLCPEVAVLNVKNQPLYPGQNAHQQHEVTAHEIGPGERVDHALSFGPPSGSYLRRYVLVEASVAPPGRCTASGNDDRTPAGITITDEVGGFRTTVAKPLAVLRHSSAAYLNAAPPVINDLGPIASNLTLLRVGPTDHATVSLYNACDDKHVRWQVTFSGQPPSTLTGDLGPRELRVLEAPTGIEEPGYHGWVTLLLPDIEGGLSAQTTCPVTATLSVFSATGATRAITPLLSPAMHAGESAR